MRLALAILTAFGLAQAQLIPLVNHNLPPETGKASIEGDVVDSVTHLPIRNANVTLAGRIALTAATDAAGHFAFRKLAAGTYSVRAQANNYPAGGPFAVVIGNVASVSVTGAEEKTARLSLTPGVVLRGRVVDEEGEPIAGCSVSPARIRTTAAGKTLMVSNSGQTDDNGDYRIENNPAGKYYVEARCFQNIPMPHALIRRDAMAVVPTLTYPPLFYPASGELSGATRVTLAAGTELSGIDFRMAPATGVPVRGRVQPLLPDMNLQLTLRPKDPLLSRRQQNARADPANGEFRISNVRPGSYELLAATFGGPSYSARVPVEVGATAPDPIDLVLTPAQPVAGSIRIDAETNVPLKNIQVFMNPADGQFIAPPPPPTVVRDDLTFTMAVPPGRWRLQVNAGQGYIKSVMLGDQEVSPSSLEIGLAPPPLQIVIGTKRAQVDGSVSGLPPDATSASVFTWTAGGSQYSQTNYQLVQRSLQLSLAPGRYYACAVAPEEAPVLMQADDAFRKAIAGHCSSLEVSEGDHITVQIPFLAGDELKRLADTLEIDDPPAF
ncbi:MAG TPA: carboxypeptidase regulatory-like domain-containing protein [Bryobacteraceae bacterium]